MKIEHAALYVNDLEKARSFFVNYLGAESNDGYHNPRTGFRSYFLSFDGSARLEIMNKPELADSPKNPPAPDTRTLRSAQAAGKRWMH